MVLWAYVLRFLQNGFHSLEYFLLFRFGSGFELGREVFELFQILIDYDLSVVDPIVDSVFDSEVADLANQRHGLFCRQFELFGDFQRIP